MNDTIEKLLEDIRENPHDIEPRVALARSYEESKQYDLSLEIYHYLIEHHIENLSIDVINEWYKLYSDLKRCEIDPRDALESLYKTYPNHAYIRLLYAQVLVSKSQIAEAVKLLESILSDDIEILKGIAGIYKTLGLKEQHREYKKRIMEIDPMDLDIIISDALENKISYGDEIFQKLNYIYSGIDALEIKEQTKLHYILGKICEDVDDLESAFAHYKQLGVLNAQGRESHQYASLYHYNSTIKKSIDSGTFFINKGSANKGSTSNKPIFIVGMPRSGTTLLEQVLSSMGGVYGAGELNYVTKVLSGITLDGKELALEDKGVCFGSSVEVNYLERGKKYLELIEQISPKGSKRVIDKMPHNFQVVGLLHLILPNASIIHARRHPVETCLSAYRINFKEGHYWSDDLAIMGKYYKEYYNLMKFWKSLLPKDTMIEVKYEDMVSDLEGESKRVAEYIDMPWSPKCLEFHKSQRAVKTASVTQVREPIYTRSTNRWRKYEPYLQPLLDEIGDIVEEYETELG